MPSLHPLSAVAAGCMAATLVVGSPLASGLPHLTWQLLPTGSSEQFRGLAPVSGEIAWVSGTNATVLRTTDGGRTWASVGPVLPPEDVAHELQFRDMQAWSADEAAVLSIGNGADSRVYRTTDGGASWVLAFRSDEEEAFYNCMDFEESDKMHGIAVSDPVQGKFRLIETRDGGGSWTIVDPVGLPPALDGEAGFSASGTCISTRGGRWYAAAGGVDPGRIFSSDDGRHWDVTNSTIKGSPSGGVFSVRFRDERKGLALGGDFENPTGSTDNAAWSDDGGVTWNPAVKFPGGYRSGSSWVPGLRDVALAVGPTGSDYTIDGGRTWHGFYNGSFDSIDCLNGGVCWASGEKGRVARLRLE